MKRVGGMEYLKPQPACTQPVVAVVRYEPGFRLGVSGRACVHIHHAKNDPKKGQQTNAPTVSIGYSKPCVKLTRTV